MRGNGSQVLDTDDFDDEPQSRRKGRTAGVDGDGAMSQQSGRDDFTTSKRSDGKIRKEEESTYHTSFLPYLYRLPFTDEGCPVLFSAKQKRMPKGWKKGWIPSRQKRRWQRQ